MLPPPPMSRFLLIVGLIVGTVTLGYVFGPRVLAGPFGQTPPVADDY